ncbi:hypothetical protein CYJ46_11315 [Corynebacterium coyleae]|uniref:DUF262 domain-containing protein n=1 Tax=Corynebacterium coyleae TaxID=53374 RepID=UPI000C77728D|nr:DUF262 domain-containing protein [Corynebacterium coyleae]PLA36948.1 hypothetical protein CYJ46_11315 [Corynebacterium coyleae]
MPKPKKKLTEAASARIVKKFAAAQEDLVLQTADYPLAVFKQMADGGTLDLSPTFQRRDRWNDTKRSQLIESFLLNVPVPPVYFAEEGVGRYSVIDGKQRLSSGVSFINNEFALEGLENFTDLNGLTFNQLPDDLQSAISARPYLRVVILLKQSSPELKYEVFQRLNRGGVRLNDQEIRNSVYRGPLNSMIYELSENAFLRKKLKIEADKEEKSTNFREMTDAEYVTRFFALREGWREYTGGLRETLDKYMGEHQNAAPEELKQLRDSFERAIAGAEAIFGEDAFKRPQNGTFRNQTTSAMFDSEMIAIDMLSDSEISALANKTEEVKARLIHGYESGESVGVDFTNFHKHVTQATNTPSFVVSRIKTMHELLKAMSS